MSNMVNGRLLTRLIYTNYGYDTNSLFNRVTSLFELMRHGCNLVTDEVYEQYQDILSQIGYSVPYKVIYVESKSSLTDKYLDINKINKKKYVKRLKDLSNVDNLRDIKIVAFQKIKGYDIRIVYSKGKLVSAVTYGENGLGMDIKDIISTYVKEYDDVLKDLGIVEFRAKLTVKDLDIDNEIDLLDLVNFNKERLELYIVDIICSGLDFNNPLDKISIINELGYSVPKYSYIKCEELTEEVIQESMKGLRGNIEIDVYSGKDFINKALCFEINSRLWNSKNITGIVESVKYERGLYGLEPIVDIVYSDEGERKVMNDISLYTIGIMSDNGYYVNNEIYFELYTDGSIQLLTPKGKLLL